MTAAPYTGPLNWRPTEHRVWRGSYDENDERAQVAMPFRGQEQALPFIDWYLLGLEKFSDEKKQYGATHPITSNMIKIVRVLLRNCTNFATGRCTPSIETIMEKTRFCRETVIRLLAKLRESGVLDWIRRTTETGEAAPAVKQTSNAYFVDLDRLPREIFGYLRQKLRGLIDLDKSPRHKGSPKLPPFEERLMGKFVSQVTRRMDTSRRRLRNELTARAEQISTASTAQEAAVRWPNDLEAQRFYEESMRSPRGQVASLGPRPECPLKGEKKKE